MTKQPEIYIRCANLKGLEVRNVRLDEINGDRLIKKEKEER